MISLLYRNQEDFIIEIILSFAVLTKIKKQQIVFN